MILLREYNVSPEGKWLTINVAVDSQYTGAYLKAIKVSGDGSFTDSVTTVLNAQIDDLIDFTTHPTLARLVLDVDTINKPFFLYVLVEDPNNTATTCAAKKELTAVTFNKYPFYKALACATHELDGCDIPRNFIDFLMQLKALEASIAIYDVDAINKYFNMLIAYKTSDSQPIRPRVKPCGCSN